MYEWRFAGRSELDEGRKDSSVNGEGRQTKTADSVVYQPWHVLPDVRGYLFRSLVVPVVEHTSARVYGPLADSITLILPLLNILLPEGEGGLLQGKMRFLQDKRGFLQGEMELLQGERRMLRGRNKTNFVKEIAARI